MDGYEGRPGAIPDYSVPKVTWEYETFQIEVLDANNFNTNDPNKGVVTAYNWLHK